MEKGHREQWPFFLFLAKHTFFKCNFLWSVYNSYSFFLSIVNIFLWLQQLHNSSHLSTKPTTPYTDTHAHTHREGKEKGDYDHRDFPVPPCYWADTPHWQYSGIPGATDQWQHKWPVAGASNTHNQIIMYKNRGQDVGYHLLQQGSVLLKSLTD